MISSLGSLGAAARRGVGEQALTFLHLDLRLVWLLVQLDRTIWAM